MSGVLGFVRDAAKELRRVPVLTNAFVKTDPIRRARRIVQSGLVDAEFYAVQLGVDAITEAEAADHYVRTGALAGLMINPFLDDATLRRALGATGRPAGFEYLWRRDWTIPVSPFWDVADYMTEHPEARDHPEGPVGHLWSRVQAAPDTVIELGTAANRTTLPYREWRTDTLAGVARWGHMDDLRRRRRLDDEFSGTTELGEWPSGVKRPLVSIVLATWNRSGQLREAVESVISQTWQDWELLIVDDGSWDDTPLVADVLTHREPRVRYVPRTHEGVSATRNAGIAAARGEFVTFIDSDNTWLPRFLEDMMLGMRRSSAPAAYATLESVDGPVRRFRQNVVDEEMLSLGNLIDLNTLVVRREALDEVGGFDEGLARAVDYDLIFRLAKIGTLQHVPILGAVYDNDETHSDRISTSEPLGWNTYVRVKNLIDWEEIAQRPLRPGVHYVVILHAEDPHLDEKCEAARELASDPDTDVLLFFIAPRPSDWLHGWHVQRGMPRLEARILSGPAPYSFVVASALSEASREVFVVVESAIRFDAETLRALGSKIDPQERRVVAPLRMHADGTIATIGAAFPRSGAAPVDLFSRHPLEDGQALGIDVEVPAISGKTFAIPTAHLVAVRGIDPLLYNEFELPALSVALRARDAEYSCTTSTDVAVKHVRLVDDFPAVDHNGSLAVIRTIAKSVPASDLDPLYGKVGLRVAHFRAVTGSGQSFSETTLGDAPDSSPRTVLLSPTHHLQPVVVRERRTVTVDGVEIPRLRWALRIAAPAGPVGEVWGDTHFARSLAKALRALGQEVVIDHHEIDRRPTASLDDVTVVVRGLDEVAPATAGTSILWIISHPDQVTRREAQRFDHVFAASIEWSRTMSERWGVPITPLLQCTDPALFSPPQIDRTDDIVFVGKSRGVPRTSVVAPVRAGIPVRVFGPEWEGILPEGSVEAQYFPNAELASLYGSARIILNDHWSDMRRDGFLSNRLFDVVAAGGRVLSDSVEGIEDLFSGAVQTYADGADLVAKLRSSDEEIGFPTESEMERISARIRDEHSFLARARALLSTVLAEDGGLDTSSGR